MINLENTRLLGHRGARQEVLENSWFGFVHAQRLQARGLSGVEFDVQLTADGHLIVFHDDTLQRLCGLQSRVDQLSLAEIQRHLQSGQKIITLDALTQHMPAVKPSLSSAALSTKVSRNTHTLTQFSHIELEIKTHNRTDHAKLIRALNHYLLGSPLANLPIVLTSFDRQLLAQLQRSTVLQHIPRGLLVHEPKLIAKAPNTALQLGCIQLGIHYPLLSQSLIRDCHRHGLPVSAWTVNDIAAVEQLVQWQVDVIITDIPTQLL